MYTLVGGGGCINQWFDRLFFSIFTTPVGDLFKRLGASQHQYADDTQRYTITDRCATNAFADFSACAESVTEWHLEHNILFHPTKTDAIVTGTRQQLVRPYQLTGIMVSQSSIPFVAKLRILGVIIDNHLTFSDHIAGVVRACNFDIRALRHVGLLLTKETANTIFCAIV